MAADPLVLAIDIGTSSCRAGLFDASGQLVPGTDTRSAYLPRTTGDGGAELDPERLFEQVVATLDATLAAAQTIAPAARSGPGSAAPEIAAVGICTFWHSLLGVDRAGQPLTPLYLWMDARSRDEAAWLRTQFDERATHARTGAMLHWSYWPAKLRWLATTRPDVVRQVQRWLSFGEFLELRLCGEPRVSISMASGTGLWNQHTQAWDEPILHTLDLDARAFSVLADDPDPDVSAPASGPRLREPYASRWPALRRAQWLPAIGDGAASNVGAGCTTRQRAALMIGTSGAMRVLWRADQATIPWGLWGYRLDSERLVLGGALNDGGSLYAWLRDTLRLPDPALAEAAIAAMEPDAHGLTILPMWAGERSPGWADDARGAIIGMRLDTTPTEILRAALEAIALRFVAIAAILHRDIPEATEIVATGGALLKSPAWMQIMADALGCPVEESAEPEASLRGAALVALAAVLGSEAGIDELRPHISRTYEPILAHTERYSAAAARQERLYRVLIGEPAHQE